MRAVVQRVSGASVSIGGKEVGSIDRGLLILAGVSNDDTDEDARYLAEKCVNLRIFNDAAGKMNLSVSNVGGSILSISQFTLHADTRKGRRPSFIKAARPEKGMSIYDRFNTYLKESGIVVKTGEFGAMMDVKLVNEGPVTILIDSAERLQPRRS